MKRHRSKDKGLLTAYETWIHCYEPENKCQSHQWVEPDKVPGAKEIQNKTIFWHRDDHRLLRHKRCCYVALFIHEYVILMINLMILFKYSLHIFSESDLVNNFIGVPHVILNPYTIYS